MVSSLGAPVRPLRRFGPLEPSRKGLEVFRARALEREPATVEIDVFCEPAHRPRLEQEVDRPLRATLGSVAIALTPGLKICQIFLHLAKGGSQHAVGAFSCQRRPQIGHIKLDEIAQKLARPV